VRQQTTEYTKYQYRH